MLLSIKDDHIMRKWKVNAPDLKLAGEMKLKCDLSLFALKLMTARGFCDFQQVVDFFSDDELEDPLITADMEQAADTINEFIDSYRLICIYGDYDCDGVTAAAILYSYLQSMGANVTYYINEREEGYGMTIDAVRKLHEQGVELIVTVDNGISCVAEAEEIYKLGMKLVVTDHHQPPEILPRAEAVVDPHRADCPSTFKDLAGAGVALKLCAALDGGFEAVVEQYADICSIGTVGDVVSLRGENRSIVRQGLMYMQNTENYGLNALIDKVQPDRSSLNARSLSFRLCPKINAAGRFDSPLLALKALLTEDPEEADSLTERLLELNAVRRETEGAILEEIYKYIDDDPAVLNDRVLVLCGKGWHHGVIGIVSARVMETYGKPNIIISIDEDGTARGSARSLPGFSIHACLTYASEYLDKFGGHECAGGLSLKERYLPQFKAKVQEFADKLRAMPADVTECDMVIPPEDITIENIRSLEVLEPFGAGNPYPLFCLPNCRVNAVYPLSGGKHSKIDFTYGGKRFQALIFSTPPQELFFSIGSVIDIAANIEINVFNGNESIAIKAEDIKPHGMDTGKYLAARDCYEKFRKGVPLPPVFIAKITPTRAELVNMYKLIAATGEVALDTLFMKINSPAMNFCKLHIIADIFCEAGIAQFTPSRQSIKTLPVKAKADLSAAPTMRLLAQLSR